MAALVVRSLAVMRLVLSATISTRESFHQPRAIRVLERRLRIWVLMAAGGERGMGTVGLGGLRWSPRWVAGVVVAMAAVAVVLWMVLDEGDVRRTTRRVVKVDDAAAEQREVIEESGKREAQPEVEPPVPVVQPEFVQIVKPREPEEILAMEEITEIRIELPIHLHIAGRPIAGAEGVDGKAAGLPPMLFEMVARAGWTDPGLEVALENGSTLYLPANNRLTMLEAVFTRSSLGGLRHWNSLVAWAHGLQSGLHSEAPRPLVAADVSNVRLVPRLRGSEDLQQELDYRAANGIPARELDEGADPMVSVPVSPSTTGILRTPVAVWEARVESRRPGRVRKGEVSVERVRVSSTKRLLVRLATHDMDVTRLDAPGMVIGYGMLSHPALDRPLPMIRPKVLLRGEWDKDTSDIKKSPPSRSEVVQCADRFIWFVWDDVRRMTALLPKQLESQSDWRLWTLEEELTPESDFLSIALGRPTLVNLGLDFGEIVAKGTMLTVELQRGPAPLPLELADKPVGVKLDVLVVGPKRAKELPRRSPPPRLPRQPASSMPTETMLELLRYSNPWHAIPVELSDWQYHVFIPGDHSSIVASAFAPAHPGIRWKQMDMKPEQTGPELLILPQDWESGIYVTAHRGNQPLTDASYTVLEVHYESPRGVQYFPEKFGPATRSPAPRHCWRLDSSLYGTRFRYPYAPTLSDWEFMYGSGKRWIGVHETKVAEELRTKFLAFTRQMHHQLEVPEAATVLMWREAGPRLEESEMANVGKSMPRQPHLTPPLIPVVTVPDEAFEAAKELTKLPPHFELPQPIVEKPKGRFPEGTRRCLYSGTWVFAAHRDHGFGFVFIPIGWKDDVKIELEPWSTIGWDWKYIPRGHWPDGTPASYNPDSAVDPKAETPIAPPVTPTPPEPAKPAGTPTTPGRGNPGSR